MATAAIGEHPKGWRLLKTALANRKTAIMLIFGFAAGLPYTLLIGTLNAWLGEWQIDLATIGVLSWIGLAYAFKFLWSPLVDRVRLPGLERLGRRRSWLLVCQILLTLTFFGLALSDPRLALGWFALVAVIGAFASATQDVVIDAWRIDVADEQAPVEILSSIYQFGYRIAALIGGALALVLSERVSWPTVYAIMGGFMAAAILATLFAPDTARPPEEQEEAELRQPEECGGQQHLADEQPASPPAEALEHRQPDAVDQRRPQEFKRIGEADPRQDTDGGQVDLPLAEPGVQRADHQGVWQAGGETEDQHDRRLPVAQCGAEQA